MYFEDNNNKLLIYARGNSDFPFHIHHFIEWTICSQGTINATCNGRTETLHPGDMMIAFQYDIHSYTKTVLGTGVTITFSPDILAAFDPNFHKYVYNNFILNRGSESINYVKIAERILEEFKGNRSPSIIYGYINVLWGMIAKSLSNTRLSQNNEDGLLLETLKYISGHYLTPINLKMVAKNIGVSPAHLSRVFSQKISCGFFNYVQSLRIEYAKKLLTTSSYSMDMVAEKSGFPSQRTFNRIFSDTLGITPREYRKKHKIELPGESGKHKPV